MMTAKKTTINKLVTVLGGVEPTSDEIGLRAYFIWEREGKPQGREQQHWLQAVAELKTEREKANKSPGTTKLTVAAPKRKASAPVKTKPKAKKK